jgi:hypothetical protein
MKLTEEPHWVLVEGPGPGDAGFLGHWLLAAVDADRALEQQRKQNFWKSITAGLRWSMKFPSRRRRREFACDH